MADDDQFQLGSGNWWDHTSRTQQPSISTTLNAIASFSGGGNEQSSVGGSGGVLANPNLQMMGLGLSSHNMDHWNNQALFRGDQKSESSFRSLLQEDHLSSSSTTFQPPESASISSQEHWRNKLFTGDSSEDHNSSSIHDFKRGFSLDNQPQFGSQASPNDESSTITSAAYNLLLSENQQQPMNNYSYHESSGGVAYGGEAVEMVPSWNKFPPFLRTSPPKQAASSSHLHFSNNTPYWNASAPAATMADVRPSFFPALQSQSHQAPSFNEKPKNILEVRDTGATTKRNATAETSNKRPRNDTPSPLPAFKVRKEKMGDRITALQQLVSPFGKTDTASVLSEAIEYIKFLHEQVGVLSNPYMKNGAPIQHQQNFDKSKDPEGPHRDLRSRGLCLVPVSSTFPMTHETTNDFWTPTFGGTFR